MTDQTDTQTPRQTSSWIKRYFAMGNPHGLTRTLRYGAAALCLILFCLLVLLVHHASKGVLWDHYLQYKAYALRTPLRTHVAIHVSELASPAGVVVLFAIAGALLVRRHRKLVAVLIATLVLDGIATELPKKLIGRVRPDAALDLVHETSFSFPSGHTLAAVLCWGVIAYLVSRSYPRAWVRTLVVIGYVIAVVLVGASRIYLGAHYFSDVLGSILLGAGLLGLLLAWLTGQPGRLPAELFGRTIVWAFAAAGVLLIALSFVVPRFFG